MSSLLPASYNNAKSGPRTSTDSPVPTSMACSSNVTPDGAGVDPVATGHGAMSVDRFAANAACPSTRRVSYQLGTEATRGRLWPGLSVPRGWLFAAGAARNVTGLVAPADGTTQSSANAKLAGKKRPNRNARVNPERASDSGDGR